MAAILDESFNLVSIDPLYKSDYLNALTCSFSHKSYWTIRLDPYVDNGAYFKSLHPRVSLLLIFESWQFLNQ